MRVSYHNLVMPEREQRTVAKRMLHKRQLNGTFKMTNITDLTSCFSSEEPILVFKEHSLQTSQFLISMAEHCEPLFHIWDK